MTVPSSSIESANAEVKRVIETEESSDRRKRGHYEKFSPELRFQIGKQAAENGVVATTHFYAKKFVLKYERRSCACGKRRNQPGIVGGAVLEWPSAKIRPRNL